MLANPSSRHLSRLERMASSSMTDGGQGLRRSTSVTATPTSSRLLDADDASDHSTARASSCTPRQKLRCVICTATAAAESPKEKQRKPASLWSPRRLMERASRVFRSAGRSRRKKNRDDAVEGDIDGERSVAGTGSDAAAALCSEEQIVVVDNHCLEVIPEKIIHEANLPAPETQPPPAVAAAEQEEEERISTTDNETAAAVDDECTTETAIAVDADEEEELKKGAAPAVDDVAVTDCKLELVKEAAMKQREEEIMTEVVRRFQGSRVKTTMAKRPDDDELPQLTRRRASNEVIEEARTKLLEMRHGSKVKALVGAFETVMDANTPRTAGKPQLHHNVGTSATD